MHLKAVRNGTTLSIGPLDSVDPLRNAMVLHFVNGTHKTMCWNKTGWTFLGEEEVWPFIWIDQD